MFGESYASMLRKVVVLLCLFFACSCSVINERNSEVCFVGDSITHIWDLEYFFPGFYIHKYAANGAKIQEMDEWNLSDCEGIPTVFLMGTNNIGMYSADTKNIEQIRGDFIKQLAPRLKKIKANPLLFVSILPRNSHWRESEKVNENIEIQNEMIKNYLDEEHFNYKYVDAFYLFLEEEGYQIKEKFFYDGIHPSKEGYEVLSAKVLKYL